MWAQFKPTLFSFAEGLRFDFVPLSFLFEHGESEVINYLAMAETRHTDLQSAVNEFNKTATEIQSRLEAGGWEPGKQKFIAEELEKTLGPKLVSRGNAQACGLLHRFEEDEADYIAAVKTLRAALLKIYPTGDFVKIKPLEGFTDTPWPK